MKIIFRNPFITKKQRQRGAWHLEAARTLAEGAETMLTISDEVDEHYVKLMQEAVRHWNEAARCLGFRNLVDMNKYYEIHGSF